MRVCINDCKIGHKPDCETTENHKSCQEVEATRGLVCEKCYNELRDALIQSSDLVYHLRSIYGILRSRSTDGSQKVKKEPPAPFNLSAYELSEDIYKTVTGRTILVNATPAGIAAQVGQESDRLLSIYDTVVNRADVKELSKLIKLIKTGRKIYPLEEEIRVTAMPCPECDLKTIYTPPQHLGDIIKVSCVACGFEVPPDKIAFYAHLAEKGIK